MWTMLTRDNKRIGLVIILILFAGLYILLQTKTIYGGDAGDLVSAIVVSGIAHPPGYPLYTLLGILFLKYIPVATAAFKIGFLSSIPALLTLWLLYDLINYIFKKPLPAIISTLVLGFLYPFWLYSEVVEVFSLNNLFIVTLFWLLIHWSVKPHKRYLYLASFIFGLSLTHHHIILFLLPCLIYLLMINKNKITLHLSGKCIILFLLGLIPYIYVFIAAGSLPSLNWLGNLNFTNFVNLVTRAAYGSFQSGGFIGKEPLLRFVDIWALFNLVVKDFKIPGIMLITLGFFSIYKYNKQIFWAFLIGLASYIFFIFYASFPLVDNFMVATFERFTLPVYIFLVFFLSGGLLAVEQYLGGLFQNKFPHLAKKKLQSLFMIIFILYPLGLFLNNYPKISILTNDSTAENLGRDILASVAQNSILIISSDTPLFNTQYVYYAEKFRKDIKLIHLSKLANSDYRKMLKSEYPDINVDNADNSVEYSFFTFLEKNKHNFKIYNKHAVNIVSDKDKGVWLPEGLVFRYYSPDDKIPDDKQILETNNKLWLSYHDPLAGSLSKFQNLMLSDVLSVYATAHQEIAYWSAKKRYSEVAEKHLLEAERLDPLDLDSYLILSQVYIVEKRCEDAEKQITKFAKIKQDDERYDYLQAINYATCFKDPAKSSYYQNLYQEKKREKEIPLKKI